jgi:hypothetical protein
LSYNSDETKLLSRRKAFKKSMEFLHKLVLGGNIGKANGWSATKYLFGTKGANTMANLGYDVAEQVLLHEPEANTAAAIMVFMGLDAAYNSVLSVSTSGHPHLTLISTLIM